MRYYPIGITLVKDGLGRSPTNIVETLGNHLSVIVEYVTFPSLNKIVRVVQEVRRKVVIA